MNTSPTVKTGLAHEQIALDHLLAQGLKLERRNYRCRLGEIDLIMREGQTVVFVEVRYRRSARHGGALASISRAKARRVALSAQTYLKQHHGTLDIPMRFDVIALDGPTPDLRWLKAAFEF